MTLQREVTTTQPVVIIISSVSSQMEEWRVPSSGHLTCANDGIVIKVLNGVSESLRVNGNRLSTRDDESIRIKVKKGDKLTSTKECLLAVSTKTAKVKRSLKKKKVVKRVAREELPQTMASTLLGKLLNAVQSKTTATEKTQQGELYEAALDQLADSLFGLDLETVVQSLTGDSSSKIATIFLPEEQKPSYPFHATPHDALSLYRRVPRSVLSLPLPPHVSMQFEQIFNYFSSGAALLSTSQTAPNVSAKLVVVKGDEEGSERGAFKPDFGSKPFSAFVIQVDGLAEWGGSELESGDVCYIPEVCGTLEVTSVHGCASIVVSFCWNTISELVKPVCSQLTEGADCSVSMSEHLSNLYNSWGTFPTQFTSDLLRLSREYNHHRESYLRINQPVGSVRSPLLSGTLHAKMDFINFHRVACETISKLENNADCGINYQNQAAIGTVADFTEYGVAAFEIAHKGSSLTNILSTVISLSEQTPLSETDTIKERHPKGFFPVHYRLNRQDMGLHMDTSPTCAVRMFLANILNGGVGQFLQHHLGSKSRLVELSCLLSHPGAKGQPPHSDSTSRSLDSCSPAHLISVFVPLVDVTEEMGPLEVWPRTHSIVQLLPNSLSLLRSNTIQTGGFREFFSEAEEQQNTDDLPKSPLSNISLTSVCATVPKGHAVCMDSRLYHRGSTNSSDKTRPVFYFTFASEEGELPEGSTYSLLESMEGKVLSDFWTSSNKHTKEKPSEGCEPAEVISLSSEFSSEIRNHLHDGNTRSIIQRLPPCTVRGANQQQERSEDTLHDHLVDVQEILIQEHGQAEMNRLASKSKSKRGNMKKENGILAALEWIKNSTEEIRETAGSQIQNGECYLIHKQLALSPCSEAVALRADICGESVCVTVGDHFVHKICESLMLSEYHSVSATFCIIKPLCSSHNLASECSPQKDVFIIRCTSDGCLSKLADLLPLTQALRLQHPSATAIISNTSDCNDSIFLTISAEKRCSLLPINFMRKREIDPSYLRDNSLKGWKYFESTRVYPVPNEDDLPKVLYFIERSNDTEGGQTDGVLQANPLAVVKSVCSPSEFPPISSIVSKAVQDLLTEGVLSSSDLFVVTLPTSSLLTNQFIIVSGDPLATTFLKHMESQSVDSNSLPLKTSLHQMLSCKTELQTELRKLFLLLG